jgi:hypothetical protein
LGGNLSSNNIELGGATFNFSLMSNACQRREHPGPILLKYQSNIWSGTLKESSIASIFIFLGEFSPADDFILFYFIFSKLLKTGV